MKRFIFALAILLCMAGVSYGAEATVYGTINTIGSDFTIGSSASEKLFTLYGKAVQTASLSAATGNEVAYTLNYTVNKSSSGNDTGLLIAMTDTASPGSSKLIETTVGGTTKFSVWNTGETALKNKEWIEAATDTLTAIQVSGGLINNYGQTDDETLTLPAAAAGYSFTVILGTTVAKYFRLDPNANDKIYLDGVADDDGHYVGVASAAAGASIVCKTFQTGASAYDWACYTVSGAWSME